MTGTSARSRLVRRSAALAGVLTLCAAGTAHADITGKVTTPAGVPVPGASIEVTASGATSGTGFDTTDGNGDFSISSVSLTGDTPPFTVAASLFDPCRPFSSSQITTTSGPVNDGAVQNFTLDAFAFCASTSPPTGAAEPTGNPWPERGQVLSPPGGVTFLRVLAPSDATALALTLADGTVVGGGTDRTLLTLTAPAAPHNGPLNLTYTSNGAPVTRPIATLISGAVLNPNPPSGVSDLAAIVDISGSMSGSDPTFRRKDAVQLLVDLAGQGDRVVGTGFDDAFTEIFPRTAIAGAASKNALKRLARQKIINDGGTDYTVGLGSAFDALAADPINAQVPKAAIFLTDGANNGTYQNTHLRFAFNGTGRSWPICVVQLGSGFQASDVARLKRIARETGGAYSATPDNAELENLYFQCRGKTTGATTLLRNTSVFTIGHQRTFSRRIKRNQRKATFFVSWGVGRYRLQAIQPGGRVFQRTIGRNVRLVRGRTFSFIEILKPKAGLWRLRVTRLATGGVTDRATTTVTVQRRR